MYAKGRDASTIARIGDIKLATLEHQKASEEFWLFIWCCSGEKGRVTRRTIIEHYFTSTHCGILMVG